MLKKRNRLSTREFTERFRTGTRIRGTYMQIIYTPSDEFHGAVAVGRKILKSAAARNRLRRRVYGALYQVHKEQDLFGIFIILPTKDAVAASYTEIKTEIATLIEWVRNRG